MVPQHTLIRAPISWYGGKGHIAHLIVPLLPPHTCYVEPFCGAAWVLLTKHPSTIEVLNDVHDGVTNLYHVLRNDALFTKLERLCHLTPYSRAQWRWCTAHWHTQTDPVHKAWAFLVASRMSQSGGLVSPSWSYSRRGEDTCTTRWLSTIAGLPAIHDRLRHVQIEHAPYSTILSVYDGPDTLFYCDPPYIPQTRTAHVRYEHELCLDDHKRLVAHLLLLQAKVVLSGYNHPAYAPLEEAGWHRIDYSVPVHAATKAPPGAGLRRTESLWLNQAARQAQAHTLRLPLAPDEQPNSTRKEATTV